MGFIPSPVGRRYINQAIRLFIPPTLALSHEEIGLLHPPPSVAVVKGRFGLNTMKHNILILLGYALLTQPTF